MSKVLFLGDIVGKAGREAVIQRLPEWKSTESIDLVVANGENAAGGAGINRTIAEALHAAGVDAITLGDHVWDQRGWEKDICELPFVSRPHNLPTSNPGARELIIQAGDFRLGIVTFLGSQFMKISADNAFPTAREVVRDLRARSDAVLVEMHAETTSEKVAMGWYLDGLATVVVGTHTHIPTADDRILPRGTGYLTDAGMTGPYDSVLGRDLQPVIARFVDGMPRKFTVAEANVKASGLLFECNPMDGVCSALSRWFKNV